MKTGVHPRACAHACGRAGVGSCARPAAGPHAYVGAAPCAARRALLELALTAGVGAAAGLRPGSVRAQPAKLSKAAVKYTDAGAVEGKDCDDCSQFVPGPAPADFGTCRIVDGPIHPHGHCLAFTPKRKP
jgi:hypothetical protein